MVMSACRAIQVTPRVPDRGGVLPGVSPARERFLHSRLGVTERVFEASSPESPRTGYRWIVRSLQTRRSARESAAMPNPDRLSGLDASFLALEKDGAHMHVGSVLVFEGPSPSYLEFLAHLESRLHLVPRYRQRLAFPPWGVARPVWIDDPHFNARYHLTHSALPGAAGPEELQRLAGRVFSQQLDRAKPLWEIWLIDRLGDDRFALITKTHHALVDGVSGVDIATVLFDLEREPAPAEPPPPWTPRPEPSGATLFAEALVERAEVPLQAARVLRDVVASPDRAGAEAGRALAGLAAIAAAGVAGAPPSPLNVRIGPHRRFAWVDGDLARFKAIKGALGGTVNDAVLTVVAGALRAHLFRRGIDPEHEELKAMVPISVRAEAERGALGNRVAAMYAPLPVGVADPLERYRFVHDAMAGVKESGQAVGAEAITRLAGFAAPTVLDQAARLQSRQRFFNLTVTNVPGPQFPLYVLGRRMLAVYPQVPLVLNTALGIAIVSYDGGIHFGLLGDFDAMPDLDLLAADLAAAIAELARAAGADRDARTPVPA
jgi:diacylglycerol O-acyltransferase